MLDPFPEDQRTRIVEAMHHPKSSVFIRCKLERRQRVVIIGPGGVTIEDPTRSTEELLQVLEVHSIPCRGGSRVLGRLFRNGVARISDPPTATPLYDFALHCHEILGSPAEGEWTWKHMRPHQKGDTDITW